MVAQDISQEVKLASEAMVERVLTAMAGRAYSPRIRLLDVAQVAEAAGISQRTVYELVDAGKFPKPVKVGSQNRWRESSIIAWLDKVDPNLG